MPTSRIMRAVADWLYAPVAVVRSRTDVAELKAALRTYRAVSMYPIADNSG